MALAAPVHLLIVDDEEALCETLKMALEHKGYNLTISVAHSGEEALKEMERSAAQVVVSDLKMPSMGGVDLLRAIRERWPDTYFIIMTAFATVETAVEALKLGAVDYIQKPHLEDELSSAISSILEDINFKEGFQLQAGLVTAGPVDPLNRLEKLVREQNLMGVVVSNARWWKEREELLESVTSICTVPTSDEDPPSVTYYNPVKIKILEERLLELCGEAPTVVLIQGLGHMIHFTDDKAVKGFLNKVATGCFEGEGQVLIDVRNVQLPEKFTAELESLITNAYFGTFTKAVSKAVAHPIRRNILGLLRRQQPYSFTGLQEELQVDKAPKLAFHLSKLKEERVVQQDGDKRYYLTYRGSQIADILHSVVAQRPLQLDSEILFR